MSILNDIWNKLFKKPYPEKYGKELNPGEFTTILQDEMNKTERKMYVPYSQLDPRWKFATLGFSKKYTIETDGCFVTCLAMMTGLTPLEVNAMLKGAGAFMPDKTGDVCLINSEKAAQALGLEYLGKETDINKSPDWTPCIKEVDYSPRPGKQQHFVLRIIEDGKKYIIDPLGAVKRPINYYEKLTNNLNWEKGGFSYRLFKNS